MRVPTPRLSIPDEPSLALPRSFWKEFARKNWDREPRLFRGLFQAHFPTLEEMFAALVDASERCLRGEIPPMRAVRLYVEHEDGPGGIPYYSMLFPLNRNHLPVREDGNAHAYLERVTRWLGGKRFGVILNRAQCHHWGHWLQMRSFLSGFYETVGVPLAGADSAVFFGNYRYTPFGIHKDDWHIFYFVVEGKKTISLWPFEALSQREEVPKEPGFIHRAGAIHLRDKAEEERLLSQAQLLEGRAGDLMYWPDSYWHRAEPSEGLAVSASLGVAFRPPEFVGAVAPDGWPDRVRHTELPGGRDWRMPATLRTALQQRMGRKSLLALERERTTEWVRLLASGAMEGAAPVLTEAPLSPHEWLLGSPARPLVSFPLPEAQVLVSANGHSRAIPAPPAVRRRLEGLVERLNSGAPQQVEALEEAFFTRLTARAFSRRAFRELLDELVRWRAVRRCEPPASQRR
ncbi:hypothetical protein F0U60_40115 [Archangium minus]|uniref:JmjC domain-containing protein n=1 Tax=Archangium minus TaxID=83450 RepID=A0ABY9X2L5_9BACT|nr:hypothetical protein F0U60_40115 [Archangium minus]